MFKNLNPRQRKIMLALLGAGGLLLVTVLARRGGGAATTDATTTDATATPTSGLPTFADNGAQAAGLSSDVTTELGNVAQALQDLTTMRYTNDPPATTTDPVQQAPSGLTADDVNNIVTGALASWAGPAAQAATPSGTPNSAATKAGKSAAKSTVTATVHKATAAQAKVQATEAAKPNISTQTSGSRSGLDFQTVVKGGGVYRFYESTPGKKDYGKASGSKIYVRPASGAGKP